MSIGHHVRVILMCILTCCWRINNCAKTARFARWIRRESITKHALPAWCTKQPCARFLSRKLGLEWGEIVNGCAEISGLDDRKVLADFSTRAREIDQWQENNGLETRSNYQRIAQKITRQTKDLDVNLDELETQW